MASHVDTLRVKVAYDIFGVDRMTRGGAPRQPTSLSATQFRDAYARPTTAWSWHVNYLIGAHIARIAIRAGVHANAISTTGLAVAVIFSGLVILLYQESRLWGAAAALVGWQLAYALDCCDGQVARATGTTKPTGRAFDLMNDWIVHIAVLAAIVSVGGTDWLGAWSGLAVTVVAGVWLFPLAYEGWAPELVAQLTLKGRSPVLDTARQLRDYGLQIAAFAGAIALNAVVVIVLLVAVSVLNGLFIGQRLVVLGRH